MMPSEKRTRNEVEEVVNYVESLHQYLSGGNAENQDSRHQGNQYHGQDLK